MYICRSSSFHGPRPASPCQDRCAGFFGCSSCAAGFCCSIQSYYRRSLSNESSPSSCFPSASAFSMPGPPASAAAATSFSDASSISSSPPSAIAAASLNRFWFTHFPPRHSYTYTLPAFPTTLRVDPSFDRRVLNGSGFGFSCSEEGFPFLVFVFMPVFSALLSALLPARLFLLPVVARFFSEAARGVRTNAEGFWFTHFPSRKTYS
mmetsp:Transcript_25271/g.63614  ORF Transcript_25271/g.63614 Transcript_25271/m.63614 type:complete len:207 (-) Transcript_25271:237-857(-)